MCSSSTHIPTGSHRLISATCQHPRLEVKLNNPFHGGGVEPGMQGAFGIENITRIRSCSGASVTAQSVDEESSAVPVTHLDFSEVHHITFKSNMDSIFEGNLRASGGQRIGNRQGRKHLYFSALDPLDPATREEFFRQAPWSAAELQKPRKAMYDFKSKIARSRDTGDPLICITISVQLAEGYGSEFEQNRSDSVQTEHDVNSKAIIKVRELTGFNEGPREQGTHPMGSRYYRSMKGSLRFSVRFHIALQHEGLFKVFS